MNTYTILPCTGYPRPFLTNCGLFGTASLCFVHATQFVTFSKYDAQLEEILFRGIIPNNVDIMSNLYTPGSPGVVGHKVKRHVCMHEKN